MRRASSNANTGSGRPQTTSSNGIGMGMGIGIGNSSSNSNSISNSNSHSHSHSGSRAREQVQQQQQQQLELPASAEPPEPQAARRDDQLRRTDDEVAVASPTTTTSAAAAAGSPATSGPSYQRQLLQQQQRSPTTPAAASSASASASASATATATPTAAPSATPSACASASAAAASSSDAPAAPALRPLLAASPVVPVSSPASASSSPALQQASFTSLAIPSLFVDHEIRSGNPVATTAAATALLCAPAAFVDHEIRSGNPVTTAAAATENKKLQKKPRPARVEPPPAAKEPKKKRRLFGLLGSSSSSSSSSNSNANAKSNHSSTTVASSQSSSSASTAHQTSPTSAGGKGFFGRSYSTRSRPLSYQGSNPSTSPSVDDASARREAHFAAALHTRPAPIAEEAQSTSRSNPPFRHSIANLSGLDTGSLQPTQQDQPSPLRSSLDSFSTFNVSTTQFHDPEEAGGSKPSSAWSERNRPPGASQHPTYGSSAYLNVSDSRPSSRQSVEPSSPVQTQYIPYHGHNTSRIASANPQGSKVDISRDPSPLHQPPSQQRGLSAQPGGGNYLEVDSGKKPQAKQFSMVQASNPEGRSTPPPSKSKEDLATLDFPTLLSKHEELNDKYRKVKKYYFEKDSQVQQLQNTLAHQRLAQSRTSLDDNEYSNRFQRLDGAINNLAFNVRKDWKAVPPWLSPFVNSDATNKVTKEMTAVGRACISRWLVDEIFDRVFHPSLEPGLSASLKIIERNLRRFSPPVNTDEERDALLTKISNWRLATLDGLSEALNSPQATEYRNDITRGLVETLTSDLQMNLTTPPPAGLEAGVTGIIELAVGIAANLPLESRDVYVEYILPGIPMNDAYMKLEGTLPPLVHPGESYGNEQDQHQHLQQQRRGSADEPMGDDPIIGGFVGAGPKDKKGNGHIKKGDDERKEFEKVRFAAFMSVMVKGKSMLVKAPVFV